MRLLSSSSKLRLQLTNPKTLREALFPKWTSVSFGDSVTSPAALAVAGFFHALTVGGLHPQAHASTFMEVCSRVKEMIVRGLAGFVGCVLVVSATAADWTEFRGSAGDGAATDQQLPTIWSESDGVLWKVPLPGRGWSSPVVIDQQVWVTAATPDGKTLSASCFDLKSGETLWSSDVFTVDEPREIHTFNSYASPSPLVDEDRAYLSWGSYGLVAVDRKTFEPVWTRRDLPCHHWRGPGSSPVMDLAKSGQRRIFQNFDGYNYQYVICLDAETGETLWRTYRPRHFGSDDGDRLKAYGTCLRINAGGREQLISPTSYAVFSYDPDTGEELWRCRYEQFSTAARPVFDGKTLYVTTGFGKGAVVAVDPTGNGDVTDSHLRWVYTKTMPSKPSPVLYDGVLFCLNDKGVLITLDAATGEALSQTRLGGNYSASPLLGRDAGGNAVVYVSDESGKTLVLSAQAEPETVAENSLDAGMLASLVPVDGTLLIKTTTHLYRVGR